jgi:nitrous oxidase accessory protein NosD
VVENKSDKVIKRLIEMALDAGASSDLGRIGWGLGRGADKEKIKMYLMPYLEPGNRKGERARQLYREMFKAEPPNSPKEATKDKGLVVKTSALQSLIDSARAGDTVIVPEGVYTEPIEITKSLTLKGQSRAACVFEVTADKPAIFIDTKGKGKVTIEAVTIKWQLATSDKSEYYFAVGVKDSKAEVKNCNFVPLGNFKRSPVAINAIGFSNLTINTCRFEGFEYTVCYGEGTEGTIQDSLVMGSGHQGILLYSGATVKIIRNVVTGSKYHGVRSTGGTLDMRDNLIIENANRGVYLGNKSAHGTITNNIITGNRIVGISGFAQSDVKIYNNLILDSGQVGIGAQASCRFLLKDNIIKGNPSGIVVFLKEGARRGNLLIRRNTFWNNETDTENCEKAPGSISEEPAFRDPANGDFSLTGGKVMEQKQGLTDPKVFKALWKRWKNLADKTGVQVEAPVEAALGWLKLVDDGDYAKSFDEMAALFRGAVSKADWEKTMDLHKKGFGKVVSRKVQSKRRTRHLPTGPAGEYVIIEFESSFENKSKTAETVTLMRDRDGVWRVTRYFIE